MSRDIRKRALCFEQLEKRTLLACIVRTSNLPPENDYTVPFTLPWAIFEAAKPGTSACGIGGQHEIWFDVGVSEINLPGDYILPNIGGSTIIDGLRSNTTQFRNNRVIISGPGRTAPLSYLAPFVVDSTASLIIKGVEITGFNGGGIYVNEIGSSIEISDNDIHDVNLEAVAGQDVGTYTITNNFLHDNGSGIVLINPSPSMVPGTITGTITDNSIGITESQQNSGNTGDGIVLGTSASAITIQNNRIWNSGGDAIRLKTDALSKNRITSNQSGLNSFRNNAGEPIKIALASGMTTNQDPGDGDPGPNHRLNYPEIQASSFQKKSGGRWEFSVTMDAEAQSANKFYRFEFYQYANSGSFLKTYWFLGSERRQLGPNGDLTFTTDLPINGGDRLTVIAIHDDTDGERNGNTSEFAPPVIVQDTTAPTVVAKSPSQGSTLISSTVNVDFTFSEEVTGVVPSAFNIAGTASGSHVVGTPTLVGANTWRVPIAGVKNGVLVVAPTAAIKDVAGNSLSTSGAVVSYQMNVGDLNGSGTTDLADLAILTTNFGKTSGSTAAEGDLDLDGGVTVKDLIILRNNCDCGGGESLMGGGSGGGGEAILGGGFEESLGGGGGESLLTTTPARIYITTSGSTPGGGVLPSSVPSVLLDGPEDSVTLYVWANTGAYDFMAGAGLDIRASDENVVKATASTFYNPNIVATNYGNAVVGTRWSAANLRTPTLNPDGEGDAALAIGAGAFSFDSAGASGINDAWDGTDSPFGRLDQLYDAANAAFLVQSITLEALSGSAGLSTNIVLYVGDMAFSLDNLVETSYLTFGLGETEVANNAVGETDGTAHATISVAAQGPSALVMRAGRDVLVDVARGSSVVAEATPITPVRAVVRSTANESRRLDLRAVDRTMESASETPTARRSIRGVRGLSRLTAEAIASDPFGEIAV